MHKGNLLELEGQTRSLIRTEIDDTKTLIVDAFGRSGLELKVTTIKNFSKVVSTTALPHFFYTDAECQLFMMGVVLNAPNQLASVICLMHAQVKILHLLTMLACEK